MFNKFKELSHTTYKKSQGLYTKANDVIGKTLWLELLTLVALTFLASTIVFLMVSHFLYGIGLGKHSYDNYEVSRREIQEAMLNKVDAINEVVQSYQDSIVFENKNQITSIEDEIIEESDADALESTRDFSLEEQIDVSESTRDFSLEEQIQDIVYNPLHSWYFENTNTYLIDSLGKIMFQDSTVESFNLHRIIQRINDEDTYGVSNKFKGIYPVIINDEVCYLYNETTLKPVVETFNTGFGNFLGLMAAVAFFALVIFRLTRHKIAYIEYLSACLGEISKGDLDYQIDIVGEDELAKVAQSIMHMENKLKAQIEAQAKAEKSKNELVTNVAHDLRTPLTSIIGYIGLVKSSQCTEEEKQKYLNIAYQKAEKLKVMIEDLFQLTKLHQGQTALQKTDISLSNLLNQLVEELLPLANDKEIQIETHIDIQETTSKVDVPKITRVFENLIENAIKYTNPNETIYVELRSKNNKIYVAVSNPSKPVSQEEINQFFERFYRADASRNSAGGSGLGLAIAKNIVQLHGGIIEAKYVKDLLCFIVILPR